MTNKDDINATDKKFIKTERLTIGYLKEDDRNSLVGLLTDPEITKTFMVPLYDEEEKYFGLADTIIGFSKTGLPAHFVQGIYLEDELIGFINDCEISETYIEIGYVIDSRQKGNGYATEAVKAVLGELRGLGFRTVRAGYFEENTASRRVMEKCGMHSIDFEDSGEYRGKTHRCLYCEIEL